MALLAVIAYAGYDRFRMQDEYVLYEGERRPKAEAGQHVCHFLDMPEVRCFDSWPEVLDDMKVRWPANHKGLQALLEASRRSTEKEVSP